MRPKSFVLRIDATDFTLLEAENLVKSKDWKKFFSMVEGKKATMSLSVEEDENDGMGLR